MSKISDLIGIFGAHQADKVARMSVQEADPDFSDGFADPEVYSSFDVEDIYDEEVVENAIDEEWD